MFRLDSNLLVAITQSSLFVCCGWILVSLAMRLSHGYSHRVHRIAWCMVVLQGLVLFHIFIPVTQHEVVEREKMKIPPSSPGRDTMHVEPRAKNLVDRKAAATVPSSLPPATALPSAPLRADGGSKFTLHSVGMFIWVSGMVIAVFVGCSRYLRFLVNLPFGRQGHGRWEKEWTNLLQSEGVTQRIPLRVTSHLGPMIWRLPLSYVLYVPESQWRELVPAQRIAVLRHELAHLQRHDIWKSIALRIAALPLWFNPMVWLAVRQ